MTSRTETRIDALIETAINDAIGHARENGDSDTLDMIHEIFEAGGTELDVLNALDGERVAPRGPGAPKTIPHDDDGVCPF